MEEKTIIYLYFLMAILIFVLWLCAIVFDQYMKYNIIMKSMCL